MQASDVALLGFVSAAQRYVDKHIEDGSNLGDLNKIDISKLKNELSEQLKFLALSDSYKKELIETGAKAFEDYAKDKLGNKKNILFELGEAFVPDVVKVQEETENKETEYLEEIADAASKVDEVPKQDNYKVNIIKPANMDEVYSSVVANEKKADKKLKANVQVKKQQQPQNNIPLSEKLKSFAKKEETVKEKPVTSNNKIDTVKVEEKIVTPTIIANPGLNVTNDVFHKTEVVDKKQENSINDILDGLENLQKRKEEKKVQKKPKRNIDMDVYRSISEAYPYLTEDFIIDLYDQRFEVDRSYELDKDYIVLHRISFKDLDKLRQFVEIMVSHDFSINVDENKMIVDTFKLIRNEHGAILTSVYTLANQAAIVGGKYEGYRVLDTD